MSDPVPEIPEINSGETPMWRVLDRYRELELQLAIFGQHLSARLGMRPIDLQYFNLVHRHEAVTTGELARLLALPPATTTGITDRLVQQGWVVRERSETDRRTVVIRVDPTRLPELFAQLAPLGEELGAGLSGLDDATLEAIAGFLDHAAEATRRAVGSQEQRTAVVRRPPRPSQR